MLVTALMAGLTHEQFWDLTLHEVTLSIRAYARTQRNNRRLLAWVQSNITGAWLGNKAPSVNRLMGNQSLMGMSNAEIKAYYDRKKAAAA